MTKKEVALIRDTIVSMQEYKAELETSGHVSAILDCNSRMDCLGWLLEVTGHEDALPNFMKEENACVSESSNSWL